MEYLSILFKFIDRFMEYLFRLCQSMPHGHYGIFRISQSMTVMEYLSGIYQFMDLWNIYLDYLSLWIYGIFI